MFFSISNLKWSIYHKLIVQITIDWFHSFIWMDLHESYLFLWSFWDTFEFIGVVIWCAWDQFVHFLNLTLSQFSLKIIDQKLITIKYLLIKTRKENCLVLINWLLNAQKIYIKDDEASCIASSIPYEGFRAEAIFFRIFMVNTQKNKENT